MEGEDLVEPDERPLGAAARVGLGLLGVGLVGAGLVAGFFAVAVVAGELGGRPVQPWPVYALGLAILAFPLLLVAAGFVSLACRYPRGLRLIAMLAAAVVADVLLAVWLVRLPTDSCVANPPPGRGGAIDATGCIDRSWSPPETRCSERGRPPRSAVTVGRPSPKPVADEERNPACRNDPGRGRSRGDASRGLRVGLGGDDGPGGLRRGRGVRADLSRSLSEVIALVR